jgi:hypothetical protein
MSCSAPMVSTDTISGQPLSVDTVSASHSGRPQCQRIGSVDPKLAALYGVAQFKRWRDVDPQRRHRRQTLLSPQRSTSDFRVWQNATARSSYRGNRRVWYRSATHRHSRLQRRLSSLRTFRKQGQTALFSGSKVWLRSHSTHNQAATGKQRSTVARTGRVSCIETHSEWGQCPLWVIRYRRIPRQCRSMFALPPMAIIQGMGAKGR